MAFRINDQFYFNNIRDKMAMFLSSVKRDNFVNLQSLNIHAEEFYIEFLNILFDWELKNANEDKQNSKGIDLIDKNGKIIVQVSSTATHAKVQSSLDKIDQGKYNGFHFFFIAIVEKIPNYRKPFQAPSNIFFDKNRDIFSTSQLEEKVLYADIEKKKQLSTLFDKFFSDSADEDTRTLDAQMYRSLDKPAYLIEIVFCIDGTNSMRSVIDVVKKQSINIYKDIRFRLEEKGKPIEQIRARIILFRDYCFDKDEAMVTTRFFDLPDETGYFVNSINSMEAKGGGDEPESGLEALGLAIHSDWGYYKGLKRQIIFIWSDADAHPLGFGRENDTYPTGMAKSFKELTDWWNDSTLINQVSKRLVLFSPNTSWWNEIINRWDNVLFVESEDNNNVFNYDLCLTYIANSI